MCVVVVIVAVAAAVVVVVVVVRGFIYRYLIISYGYCITNT